MKTILEQISETVSHGFEEAGYDASYGKVGISNRPDLCEFQCNGAMAGAKAYHKAPMDIAKDVDGHVLVIPKKHCRNILDCDTDTLKAVMETVRKVSLHLTEKCGYDGINLLNASGESAGQSVNHFHIHIIPRRKNDEIDAWPHFEGAKEEPEDVFNRIRMI